MLTGKHPLKHHWTKRHLRASERVQRDIWYASSYSEIPIVGSVQGALERMENCCLADIDICMWLRRWGYRLPNERLLLTIDKWFFKMIYMGGRGFVCYSLLPYCSGNFITNLALYFHRGIITRFFYLKDISATFCDYGFSSIFEIYCFFLTH